MIRDGEEIIVICIYQLISIYQLVTVLTCEKTSVDGCAECDEKLVESITG